MFLGEHDSKFVCRRCVNFFSCHNILSKQKQRCEQQEITAIETSNESHLYGKKYFLENPLCFRIYADFEVDNEIDNSKIGNKPTNLYKQTPVRNGYYIVSELSDVLQSGY